MKRLKNYIANFLHPKPANPIKNYGLPVKGDFIVSSPYGMRIDPISKRESFHTGIDFAVAEGHSVAAIESGVVLRANSHKDYGLLVIIVHADGIASLYAHLSELLVNSGEKVKKGQVIALSGNSGRSTGAHLHFEIIKKEFVGLLNGGNGGLGIYATKQINGVHVETRINPAKILKNLV